MINYRLLAISAIFLASILPVTLRRILLIPIAGDNVVHSRRCLDTKEGLQQSTRRSHCARVIVIKREI